jgi:hypothetical protein
VTEPERRALRILIDSARRQRVLREIYLPELDATEETRECAYCGTVFNVPEGLNARRKRFCCKTHNANFHRREARLRERQRMLVLAA